MSEAALDTEYFVLSPRASCLADVGTEQSQRGRSAARGERPGQDTHSERLTTARQRAVAEVTEAQNKERERLCVFKCAADGGASKSATGYENAANGSVGQHSTCSACGRTPVEGDCMTPSRWPESLRQEETPLGTPHGRDLSSSVHDHRARLTQPVAPRLRTTERSASRSLSVGCRSCSEPPREFHSFAEMVTSFNERGVRYKRSGHLGTPERSVRSTSSVRSARSVSSSRGRVHSTSTLTFPRGPELSTGARAEMRRDCSSRSVSRGVGTPERSVRSAFSTPAVRQSEVPLTVPCGPNLATEKRARSRSVHSRTPSVSRCERSVLVGGNARSLPRVALDTAPDKKLATAACGEKVEPKKQLKPADENTKPADENSTPTGENAKPACDLIQPTHTKPAEEPAKPQADAPKDSAEKGDAQKRKPLGALAQLNITDYLPGEEAKDQLPTRAELVRKQKQSELERTHADDKERLFRFGRKNGARSGAGQHAAEYAQAAAAPPPVRTDADIDTEIAERFKSMRDAFLKLDDNRDGQITKAELLAKCREWNIPTSEAERVISEADWDHNGTLDFSEFAKRFDR